MNIVRLDVERARRRAPVVRVGMRRFRVRRVGLARLVWWWRRRRPA